ncbi:hypothetical protein DEO72_LG10g2300 [Vigna unguiculata]|uniref:Uncharacterized protein n=1 Tax=Vigna unguiculata TaxID=3917 RepID=A0A4D6NGK3_VIGUN|nr:hypothetical protein DEO72_LG10g2300 [Vigna unguiculata]
MVIHHENNIHNSFLVVVNYEGRINCAFYVSTTMNLQMLKEEIASYRCYSHGRRVKHVWFHKPVLGRWDQHETIKLVTDDDVRDMVALFLPLPHDLPMKLSVALHPPEGDNLDATNSAPGNNVDD